MRLSADGGLTWTNIVDNGPGDVDPTPGFIIYVGPIGNWDTSIATGFGSPLTGDPLNPTMDVGTQDTSVDPQSLIVQMSDTGYVPFPNQTFIAMLTLNTTGTVTYNTYRDTGNVLFGTTASYAGGPPGTSPSPTATLLMSEGPFSNTINGGSNSVVVANGGLAPYSLTLETVIVHSGPATTQTDAFFYTLPPPPCNCSLTFNSPTSITNCAGDTIPDVTATENCGAGPVAVKPTLTSVTTNGVCPQIITRNYTATDDCGNVYPFSQTITVNCRGGICGHVFADCDGSGDLTAGDVGLSKVIVSLLSGNKVVTSLMTDANGAYCFTGLAGGTYVVAVTPPTGYSQTAATTSYHWKDGYGRVCWNENDGYIHCVSSGTECWWDKSNNCHYKDSYGRDCWKDNYGGSHCQPCSYQSCNAPTNNNKITVTLTNCTSQSDVDFAYTGSKSGLSVCVTGPSYAKCGQTCTFTCTITNTGSVCFTGGTVCHTIGNCGGWGGWNNCNNYNTTCPPLSPGQHCTITQKCTFNSWNCGTVGCQSTVNCNQHGGSTCSGQSVCYSQCGW